MTAVFYYLLRSGISFLSALALRRRITGRDNVPSGACIVVANHVNLLDSPILGVSLGRLAWFLAKEELFDSPVIGWLSRQFGAFPVAKGRLDRRAGRWSREMLASGKALIIFPEGHRSENGCLDKGYPGAALLAMKSGAPILPVGISGTSRLIGKWWFVKRPAVTLNIGRPFQLDSKPGEKSKQEISRLMDIIMEHIAELLPAAQRGCCAKQPR